MYRFYGDTAAVLDGKLQAADSSITIKKGRLRQLGVAHDRNHPQARVLPVMDRRLDAAVSVHQLQMPVAVEAVADTVIAECRRSHSGGLRKLQVVA